jgi:CelD/BcsL family acetyltransferase involved in cellulose biosynthesis
MFRDVEEVAKKTYQRGMGVGFQSNQEMREHFELQAGNGWLRAYVLYLESTPAAFWIGDVYQQTFYSHFMGYDPVFAKHSPGMYLIMQTVESFCAEGKVRQIDWGLGDAQYKDVLGTSEWMEASFYLFAPTVSGLTLNLLRTPAALVDDLAKSALAHSSLLSRIKKSWRGSLRKGNG